MDELRQDLRFAVRQLGKGWFVTVVAVGSLALAVAGNATVFSLVDAVILRPLPFDEPGRLVMPGERLRSRPPLQGSFATSLPTYADLAERSRTVKRWAAFRARTVGLRGPERSEAVTAVEVTGDYFATLGHRPLRGRTFRTEELVDGASGVVLLSEHFRVERFGKEDDALGKVLVLDGSPYEVIGVVPSDASFLTGQADVWLPLTRSPAAARRDQRSVFAVGRMDAGADMEGVRREISAIFSELAEDHPEAYEGRAIDVYNLRDDVPTSQTKTLFLLLQGSVLAVLLIACVNLANLLLARGQGRRGEVALRSALGAGRGRIVRQLLTESSLLVVAGAVLGVALARLSIDWTTRELTALLPPGLTIGIDARVILVSVGVALLFGLVFGLVPAVQTFGASHAGALRDGGRSSPGRNRLSLSRLLVVSEIALSFMALGGGSLLMRTFIELRSVDPGFDDTTLLTATVRAPDSKFADDGARLLFQRELIEKAGTVAGIRSVAMASALPLRGVASADSFRVLDVPAEPGVSPPQAVLITASPELWGTLGIDLVRGRLFRRDDAAEETSVAVVNRSLAEARFPDGGVLGEWIEVGGVPREIVGVVEDVRQSIVSVNSRTSSETIYEPLALNPGVANVLVARTEGEPEKSAQPLRQALESWDRDLTVSGVRSMKERVEQFFVGIDLFNTILGFFGVLALILASLGTYGVVAYQVAQRLHELGIRMAVGACGPDITRLIARQGVTLGVLGLLLGGVLTVPLVGLIRSVLSLVGEVHTSTLWLVALILFGVTMVASLVPALRASRIDPVAALNRE